MAYTTFIPPEFRVVIDREACQQCGRCAQQCGWNVYTFDSEERLPHPDHGKCAACHRCATFCPAGAITIKKNDLAFKQSDSLSPDLVKAIWRQAETGGVQLTGMGNDKPYLRIFDHLLLDACQVTNPSIDPLREPMEMRTFLGRKPDFLQVAEEGRAGGGSRLLTELDRQLQLETPIMFGGMSYGSVSLSVHRSLAMAAAELGTFMNTGEGGLHSDLEPYQDHIIVQCASGRFGVDSGYLRAGAAVEIKIGQGAKPGIGGHLPGEKIDYQVSITRMIPQGTDAVSPAPHHDIYSIEDLAQLIHDLKCANDRARISVKLVAEVGVGTIAAGVAKAKADVILISGHDGGTGASPLTSIKHAGVPWELGLAETQQVLLLNDLRSRVVVETDGQLKTGRDVVVAALLGAEEFGFASAPLVSLGCVMMRVCHLNTCPAGIATQDPELRRRFAGKPEHVVNFMRFVATEVRELLAALGFRTLEEAVGHTECLEMRHAVDHWKAKGIDLGAILHRPEVPATVGRHAMVAQRHGIEHELDERRLIPLCRLALDEQRRVTATLAIRNVDRTVGTRLGSEITRRYGAEGLPADTIHVHFKGSAGQSFMAFVPKGVTFELEGDANDYLGKGLSGGRLVVYPPADASFLFEQNVIAGNVALYGATGGEAYIRGLAGERFCVRNSGAHAVVEGVGDHGCEYMTGGRVVILGPTGRNFAAGMSGGIAYLLDENRELRRNCNSEMVGMGPLDDPGEVELVLAMLRKHHELTGSRRAYNVLVSWSLFRPLFVRVIPHDYRRVLEAQQRMRASGLSPAEAEMAAFELNATDAARLYGK